MGRPIGSMNRQKPFADAAADGRAWQASVNGRLFLYPVEPTAAGAIPHDVFVRGSGTELMASESGPDRTLVLAGCDPLVGLLAQEIGARYGVRVLPLLFQSSLGPAWRAEEVILYESVLSSEGAQHIERARLATGE
jgi:hypothetical protein